MAPSIPDRWIPYKACGKVIEGTRIICFKVPLRKAVQMGKKEIKEIWDIQTLRETIPNLGAVIDLTNTTRYYDPRELSAAGILHQKILMPGRIVPPEDKVQLFMDIVDEFLGKDCVAVRARRARRGPSTAEALIGVHCTHGLNRTGYMVCRYMRDRLNIPAKTAIKRFEVARGYHIERENYIADILGEAPLPKFRGRTTKIKPIDGDAIIDEDKNSDHEDASKGRRQAGDKRSSDRRRSSDKVEVTNWRTEDRSSSNTHYNWGQQNSSSKEKRVRHRQGSESSFDFRNLEDDINKGKDDKPSQSRALIKKREKKLAKKFMKKLKAEEARKIDKEDAIKKKRERKILKRKKRRAAMKNKEKIIKSTKNIV